MDIYQRIISLPREQFEIDLVSTVKHPPTAADLANASRNVDRVTIVGRRRHVLSMLSGVPYQAASRADLRAVKLDGHYDLLILESEYVAPILENPTLDCARVALRVHNNERHYYLELSASTDRLLSKAYYQIESRLFGSYSPKVKQSAHALWHISADEASAEPARPWVRHVAPTYRQRQDAASHAELVSASHVALFVGSLFMPNNLHGLDWYLHHVHPQVCAADSSYELVVAGNCLGVPEERLQALERVPRVRLNRSPADLAPLYGCAAVFINPMLHGAGVKLKTLNAIEQGLPVVATPTGVEGLGLQPGVDVLMANDPGAFAAAILQIFNDRVMARLLASAAQSKLGRTPPFPDVVSEFLTCNVSAPTK